MYDSTRADTILKALRSRDAMLAAMVDLLSGNGPAWSAPLTITRPANATPYTAGDVIGAAVAALTFPNVGPSGGGEVNITGYLLEIDVAAVPAGMTTFRLEFFSVTPPSALADNVAFTLAAGDRASYLGYLDIAAPVARGATLISQAGGLKQQITVPNGGTVYAYLVTTAGFTPAGNSEVYKVTLKTGGV
jgi:hypothetical protein